jgi:CspA family cold shock protein
MNFKTNGKHTLLVMAVLHSYAQSANQTGYYLKGWTPETGHTTIQTRRVCDDLFEWLGFSVGDQIPHDFLNGLLEVGLLYTGDPTTAAENVPDDFDFDEDVKNVLTENQYNRLIGFVKSYGDQAPSRVVDLVNRLNAQTAVVDDSYIPDTPGGSGSQYGSERNEVDHGQFEGIIEEIYGDDASDEVADPLSELSDQYHSASAAVLYHHNQQPVTEALLDDDWLEYATRALVDTDNGVVAGPVCGFRVDLDDKTTVVVEIIVEPEDPTASLSYGQQGIRHRVVLGDDAPEWETTLPEESEYAHHNARSSLLKHQAKSLQIIETTLERHSGVSKQGMIEQIVGGGYLERGLRTTQNVWQDSSLLGELLLSDSTNGKAKGTVDFFNDTGGYGFIKTDTHEEDVFYHMEDIGGPDIQEGQQLRFNITEAEEGPRATDVERL